MGRKKMEMGRKKWKWVEKRESDRKNVKTGRKTAWKRTIKM